MQKVLLASGLCLLAIQASAELTGNDWRRLPASAQATYIAGVMDGFEAVASLNLAVSGRSAEGASGVFAQTVDCASKHRMTYDQVVSIVEKYMKDQPERWHTGMAFIVWHAMHEVCKTLGVVEPKG